MKINAMPIALEDVLHVKMEIVAQVVQKGIIFKKMNRGEEIYKLKVEIVQNVTKLV